MLFLSVLAQSFPTRNDAVATDSSLINVATINALADDLQALGADVLVLFVEADTGQSLADAEAYLDNALEHYQLRKDGVYKNNLFAIFIGTDPLERADGQRPLYIVYGEDLNSLFERSFGSGNLDEALREDLMIPRLQEGEFTSAITLALEEASRQLALNNTLSPSATQAQTKLPSSPTSPSEAEPASNFFTSLWWPVLLVLVILFLVFGLRKKPVSGKTKKALLDPAKNLADKKTLELLIKDLSDNAASTGHDPYLPDDPGKQTDMQLLRRLLKDERPEELNSIETQYQAAVASLKSLKTSLNADSKTTDFGALLLEGNELKAFTQSLSERWEDLELELSSFDDKRTAVEERLQGNFKAYESMRQGDMWPETAKVFKPLIDLLAQADSAKNQDRPFTALAKTQELETKLSQLTEQLPRLQEVAKTLIAFEGELAGLQEQGYKASSVQGSFESAREQFRVALDLLKRDDYKVLDAQIDEASELTEALATQVEEQIKLKDSNLKRFAELEQKGQEIKILIEKTVPVFERIESFAESNWRDIRGNGTEAQKAANRAHELFEAAQNQQALQNYEGAKSKIDMAFVELEQADELIDAIHLRLEHLNRAKDTSQEELSLVEDEVRQHLAMVQQADIDRRVTEVPEASLKEALERVEAAKLELRQTEPNWLSIWEQVQVADKLADEAFMQIRSEKEAMDRRQTLMLSEKAEARVALERILKFAHLHPQDIDESVLQRVEEAQRLYAQAEEQERQAQELQEAALAAGFERAATLFDTSQQRADAAFTEAESNFKLMEEVRQQTAAKIAEAETALRSFASFVKRNQLDRVFQSSLNQLERSLPGYDARANREELEQASREAENVKASIVRLQEEARGQAKAIEADLRRRRQEQVELERRRRALEMTRRSTGWGSWPNTLPPIIISPPRQNNIPRQVPRSMPSTGPVRLPTARSAPPVRLPGRSTPSKMGSSRSGGRMSGGGWGGSGAKKGGGW